MLEEIKIEIGSYFKAMAKNKNINRLKLSSNIK